MSWRFFRRLTLIPGVTLNFSKSGASLSVGPRGAKITVGGARGTRATVGLPGTGIHYTETYGTKKQRAARRKTAAQGGRYAAAVDDTPATTVQTADRLTMGFFKRLFVPDDEEALVDGMKAYVQNDYRQALEHLQRALHIADGAFLAAIAALNTGDLDTAVVNLKTAAGDSRNLGRYFNKYGIDCTTSLPITEHIWAHVQPDLRGVLLVLVEVLQEQGKFSEAIANLKRLLKLEPDDIVLKVSMAELLDEAAPHDHAACRQIIKLSEGIENESAVHTAMLMYKAKALHKLGLATAARDVLTAALRRKRGRPEELMTALRYERALVYESLGQKKRARSEFEKLFAESPGCEDVAQRLGLA